MTKTYYALLGIEPSAEPEAIKRAFRREIARYHPDKVQHLGPEFQEIASSRAAELTEAYRVLMDEDARRRYDQEGHEGRAGRSAPAAADPQAAGSHAAARRAPSAAEPEPAPEGRPDARVDQARASTFELVRKAALRMLRETVYAVAAGATELPARGFDAAYVVKGKRALFGRKEPIIRLLAKFVPLVDAAAVVQVWPLAVLATPQDQSGCVLLLGAGIVESNELATAVTAQRRKTRAAAPLIVPVDVRDWDALLPPETPDTVRSILQSLKAGKGQF